MRHTSGDIAWPRDYTQEIFIITSLTESLFILLAFF